MTTIEVLMRRPGRKRPGSVSVMLNGVELKSVESLLVENEVIDIPISALGRVELRSSAREQRVTLVLSARVRYIHD